MFWECIYTLSAFILATHLYFRYSRAGRLMAKIPGPKEHLIMGNFLTIKGTPVELFKKIRLWHKTYGRIFKLQGFMYRTVHLSQPEDLEVLLSSSRYNNKDMPYTFLYNWLGNGLLVSNDEIWQRQRKMLTPAFHFTILQEFFNSFCKHTQILSESLEVEVSKIKTDISPFIQKLSVGAVCETLFGTKAADITSVDKYIENIHRLGIFYLRRLSNPLYLKNYLYSISPYFSKEMVVVRELHNFTEEIIRKRKAETINDRTNYKEKQHKIMLDILLDEVNKGNIDEKRLRDEVNTFLFESFDTTATALTFAIMRLANETAIQNSIHKELETIFGNSDRDLTIEDLRKMKYLECCIKESLRLYPSVPLIARYNTEDLTIAGYRIPKNTYYSIHIFDLHRNPDIYPDPEKFIPERFLPENSVKRYPYAYIPFSAGSRNCIGQKFAMMEMKTVLAGIFRKYRLEPVIRPEEIIFNADMVLRVSHPLYVRFCLRTPSF